LTILDAAMFAKPSLTVCDWIGMAAQGGGVVTVATADDYAEGLRRLMSDMEGCRTLGRRAREYGLKRYSREVTLEKWSALLERVSVRALL
jgi:glycosyltransferase involved in cell wall biosynthesis